MSWFPAIATVALGGALGAVLRYAAGLGIAALLKGHDLAAHAATLAVNLAGCLAIGALLPWLLAREADGGTHHLRLLLVVGLLGSFTTFSAFGQQTIDLLRDAKHAHAVAYVGVHIVAGIAAVAIGAWVTSRFVATSG
ncbi:MAG: fluoride efflux transporter CrcB [Planctomycetota bacterium]